MTKLLTIFSLSLILFLDGCQRCLVKKDFAESDVKNAWAETLAYAEKHLPKSGTLVQQSDGFAYIKVDDRYIFELFPRLLAEGFEKPPYFRRKDSPGAHISVFYENEHIKAKEVGQNFNFKLIRIVEVKPNKNTSYIVLQVEATDLEKLRKGYGLTPKLNNHEFHISLAKKEWKNNTH